MTDQNRKPRELKLYNVRNSETHHCVYVKAKSKTEALSFVVDNMFTVNLIGPKDIDEVATNISNGVEIHTA